MTSSKAMAKAGGIKARIGKLVSQVAVAECSTPTTSSIPS
jgi:hypothetical protein